MKRIQSTFLLLVLFSFSFTYTLEANHRRHDQQRHSQLGISKDDPTLKELLKDLQSHLKQLDRAITSHNEEKIEQGIDQIEPTVRTIKQKASRRKLTKNPNINKKLEQLETKSTLLRKTKGKRTYKKAKAISDELKQLILDIDGLIAMDIPNTSQTEKHRTKS